MLTQKKKISNFFLGKKFYLASPCCSSVCIWYRSTGVGNQSSFHFTYVLGNIQLIHKSNQMMYMVSKKNFFQFHPNPFSWYSSQTFGIFFNCLQRTGFMIIRFFCDSSIKPAQIKPLRVRWRTVIPLITAIQRINVMTVLNILTSNTRGNLTIWQLQLFLHHWSLCARFWSFLQCLIHFFI